jgi:hypothetical protein
MSTITSTSPVADRVAEIEAEIEKRSADIDERIKDAVFERRDLTAGEKYASERDKAQIDKLEAELDEIRGQAAELRSRQLSPRSTGCAAAGGPDDRVPPLMRYAKARRMPVSGLVMAALEAYLADADER